MKCILSTFLILCTLSCKKEVVPVKKDLKEIAKEIMIAAKNCALITVDSLGVAHARTMDPFEPQKDFTVWMGTNAHSLKVKQLQQNKQVTLYYFDAKSGSYATLQGFAYIVNDKKLKDTFWKTEWESFYKNKETDYLLLKFKPISAAIISEKYHILGDSISWKTPIIKF